ncbi:hypothetical protein [Kitasatospora aureofaciens]|nr:hypothetical protein [Kitasatospora aureofaciens]
MRAITAAAHTRRPLLNRPPELAALQQQDEARYRRGLPNALDLG